MIGNHGIKTYSHVIVRLTLGKTRVLADTPAVAGHHVLFRFQEVHNNKKPSFVSKDIKILCSPHRHKLDNLQQTIAQGQNGVDCRKLYPIDRNGKFC